MPSWAIPAAPGAKGCKPGLSPRWRNKSPQLRGHWVVSSGTGLKRPIRIYQNYAWYFQKILWCKKKTNNINNNDDDRGIGNNRDINHNNEDMDPITQVQKPDMSRKCLKQMEITNNPRPKTNGIYKKQNIANQCADRYDLSNTGKFGHGSPTHMVPELVWYHRCSETGNAGNRPTIAQFSDTVKKSALLSWNPLFFSFYTNDKPEIEIYRVTMPSQIGIAVFHPVSWHVLLEGRLLSQHIVHRFHWPKQFLLQYWGSFLLAGGCDRMIIHLFKFVDLLHKVSVIGS